MLDLETLDTTATSVVVTIGAVVFDSTSIHNFLHVILDMDEQIKKGRTVSGSTLRWWMSQNNSAKQAAFSGPTVDVARGLQLLAEFIPEGAEVWGNGAMFDNAIMTDLYAMYHVERPWSYRSDRCYRTMRAQTKALFPSADIDVEPEVAHNAVDDAMAQALSLQKMWHAIRTGGETE